jgi:hypothetical protein
MMSPYQKKRLDIKVIIIKLKLRVRLQKDTKSRVISVFSPRESSNLSQQCKDLWPIQIRSTSGVSELEHDGGQRQNDHHQVEKGLPHLKKICEDFQSILGKARSELRSRLTQLAPTSDFRSEVADLVLGP